MTDQERRVLQMLAAAESGCSDALLLAYGFRLEMILGLVSSGLAAASAELAFVADHPVELTRVKITEAGGRALAEQQEQANESAHQVT
jgi:hypothetical protein